MNSLQQTNLRLLEQRWAERDRNANHFCAGPKIVSVLIGVVFESRAGRVYGLDRLEDVFADDQFEAFSQTVNHYSRHGNGEARKRQGNGKKRLNKNCIVLQT